jgi:signal transduction histidine kinase
VRRLTHVLVATSIAGALASLLAGFLWARRVTRPIYALVEETDAALAEHRQRLMQSEKLSAVGELAAKLAHEVLNPLAGMKAAIQLLARQGEGGAGADSREVLDTAEALNRELTRVEGLVRRLVNFSRPLAPRVEQVPVATLLEAALEAAQPILKRHRIDVRRVEDVGLEPVEVDPLLFTQVLVNLLVNAAEAMAATGGTVELTARRLQGGGRDQIAFRVADRGPGISPEREAQLFKPFFTTKPEGHGLGLAVSQNIVLEHGGRIVAQNRTAQEGTGASFEVQLPARAH